MFVELLKDHLGQKAGYRFDTEDAIAQALITGGTAKKIDNDPLAPVVAKSIETMLSTVTTSLSSAIDAGLKDFAQAAAKSRKNGLPIIFGDGNSGDPKKTFGSFLLALRRGDRKALEDMGSRFTEWEKGVDTKAAMSTQTGTQGGWAVPQEQHDRIMAVAVEQSVVRSRAMVLPMSGRAVQMPIADIVTAPSAGDTAFLSGLVARWTEEATTLNETEPVLKMVELVNYELSGYSKISNTLADDAPGLETFLQTLFGNAIGWYEDYAFLRGDGVKKPLGILTWGGLISVTRSAASAFALADYAGMLGRWISNYSKGFWACHPTVLPKLFQLSDAAGNVIQIDTTRERPQLTLGGLPVQVTEKLPALNTAGDILLCDGSQYVIGDRGQTEIAFSEHAAFTTNQTLWRFVRRVGGQPWNRDKITLADATSTLSPFIALAAG